MLNDIENRLLLLFHSNTITRAGQREKRSDAETIMFYSFAFLRNRESVYSMGFLCLFPSFQQRKRNRARATPTNKKAIFFSPVQYYFAFFSPFILAVGIYSFFVRSAAVRVEFYCYCCY